MKYQPEHTATVDFKVYFDSITPAVSILGMELNASDVLEKTSPDTFRQLFSEWTFDQGITCNIEADPDQYCEATRELIFPDGLRRRIANELYSARYPNDERIYYTATNKELASLSDLDLTRLICQETDIEFKEYSIETQIDMSSFFMTRTVLAQSEEIAFQLAEELPLSDDEQETASFNFEVCGITAEGIEGEDL